MVLVGGRVTRQDTALSLGAQYSLSCIICIQTCLGSHSFLGSAPAYSAGNTLMAGNGDANMCLPETVLPISNTHTDF